MRPKVAILTRTALLLALALLFQSIRLLIPIPPLLSTFLIGSLMNSCFLIAAEMAGAGPAIVLVSLVPIVAYFQQVLPLPIFIIPVAGIRMARKDWYRRSKCGLKAKHLPLYTLVTSYTPSPN